MSYFHPESSKIGVTPNSYGETVAPTNTDVIESSIVHLRPISSDVDAHKLSFRYDGDPYYHIDLARTLMSLECQILDDKDQIIPAPRGVFPSPSFLTTVLKVETHVYKKLGLKQEKIYPLWPI